MPKSVFDADHDDVWGWQFATELTVGVLAGGIPTDPRVIESWIKSKVQDSDAAIQQLVAATMVERGVSAEDAVKEVGSAKHFTGFKRQEGTGYLYFEGRQVKAAIKEAWSTAVAAGMVPMRGWGVTSKFAKGFVEEHIMVPERTILILKDGEPITKADGIDQQFVHGPYGSAPHYKEYVKDAELRFTVECSFDFGDHWSRAWLMGEQQGIGASRSGGFGTYAVTQWDLITTAPERPILAAAKASATKERKKAADSKE